ncbi:MAG: hypothetical protein H7Z16_18125 [Pyrinomonadaceae bacterium]|nr:hypothetical protein [Pyrinomonadaceae bacterium]
MEETTGSDRGVVNELCDALRYLGDASYAILPKDVAHNLGDLKKSFLSTIRTLIDKDIEWVDARVAGGDRVREEWQQKCRNKAEASGPEPVGDM